MKDSTPDFPPFDKRQLDRLEELKAEIEGRDAFSALDPEMPKINERIKDLSVIVARFALKNIPKESRRPGKFITEVATYGGRLFPGEHWHNAYLEVKPGFAIFHPELPPWAKKYFVKWIQECRAGVWGPDDREVLRKTGIVGIETGMKRPVDMTFLRRVLELRDYKGKDDPDKEDNHMSDSVGEDLDESFRIEVTDEMLRNARRQGKVDVKEKKRTRNENRPWWRVIEKLVKEGLVKKVKTPLGEKNPSVQAFKKMLKNRYSFVPWDEI